VKRIYTKEEYCIGCRLCEVYCLTQHSHTGLPVKGRHPGRIVKAYKGVFPRAVPRLVVEEEGYLSFALQCRHCDDAPCLDACITGAIYRDEESGAILCDEDKCVGCWMCIMVCPFGVVRRGDEDRIASKCDLCIGEDEPVCVKNCPNAALVFEER